MGDLLGLWRAYGRRNPGVIQGVLCDVSFAHPARRQDNMFGLFKKNPTKKLQKQYEAKLQQAIHMQRNGKIREYSFLTAEAEEIRAQLEALKAESKASG